MQTKFELNDYLYRHAIIDQETHTELEKMLYAELDAENALDDEISKSVDIAAKEEILTELYLEGTDSFHDDWFSYEDEPDYGEECIINPDSEHDVIAGHFDTLYEDGIDFNHPTKSLIQQENELIDQGFTEDDLSRFYPSVIRNDHPNVCLCPVCAPDEYSFQFNDTRKTYHESTLVNIVCTEQLFIFYPPFPLVTMPDCLACFDKSMTCDNCFPF